uniref:Uncharacterized protein n=1 Tax=Rhizophora mucronata TaxID=61149 RepID=A0A2P2Q993_RHIMU
MEVHEQCCNLWFMMAISRRGENEWNWRRSKLCICTLLFILFLSLFCTTRMRICQLASLFSSLLFGWGGT